MQETKSLIRAGAILLPETALPADLLSDDLVARKWEHCAFVDPIVRLETKNMLSGVDLEMDILGFDTPTDLGVVGQRLRRKLGFPGWALVHQPQHAKYALAVVKQLRKAARKIKSKPGAGKEMIDAIGEQLAVDVPQFLPSFFEEAARIFLSYENYTYGAQYFEKARNAERVYALQVDQELREQSFVDFALARALSIKSLTNFGVEMIDKGEAKDGYHSYFRIAVRRTRGGLPPSPTMAKDLKKLTKAAGLDPNEEEKNFVRELLAAPALRMASEGFWKAYKKAIVALVKEDPSCGSTILDLFPKIHPRKWFLILDACKATEALFSEDADPKSRSNFTTSQWFTKILTQQLDLGRWRSGDDTAEGIFELMNQCAARLREDGIAIVLPSNNIGIDPDIVELGLSLGLEFSLSEETIFSNLSSVGKYQENKGRGKDWEYISQSPVFRDLALRAIDGSTYRMPTWVGLIPTRPHFKGLVGEWLEGAIEKTEGKGALIESFNVITRFTNYPQILWKQFPALCDRLLETNVAVQLRKTLAIGILDELCWPDLDAVLSNFSKPDEVSVSGFYPFLVVYDDIKFYVLGPDALSFEGEIPRHAGYPLDDIIYSKNTVLMIFKKSWGDWKAQWLGGKVFDVADIPNYREQSFILPDGRVMFDGHRIFTPGDQDFKYDSRKGTKILSDGDRFWKGLNLYEGKKKYIKYDPLSPTRIPNEDVPFLVENGEHFLGDLRRLSTVELGSPIRTKDGLFGIRWQRKKLRFAYEDLNEISVERDGTMTCFFHMPGSEVPRVFCETYNGYYLENDEGIKSVDENSRFNRGGFRYLNSYFFGYFRPRNEETSIALRNISLEKCEELIQAGLTEDALSKAVSACFSEADEKLVRGIAGIVSSAVEQKELLEKFSASLDEDSKVLYKTDPDNFKEAFEGFIEFAYSPPRVLSQIQDVSNRLRTKKEFAILPDAHADWLDVIGQSGAVALRYANEVDPDLRDTLGLLLTTMSAMPFLEDGIADLRLFYIPSEGSRGVERPSWRKERNGTELKSTDAGVIYSQGKSWSHYVGFEIAPAGTFSHPTRRLALTGWGSPDELEIFFALCESKGRLPVSEILEDFCEACGLTEVEGWLALTNWSRDVNGKSKISVVKSAKDVFEIQRKSEIEFLGELFSSGSIEDLWNPAALKKRAIATWLDGLVKLPIVNTDTMLGFGKVAKKTNSFVLREISNPSISTALNKDKSWSWKKDYVGTGEGFSDAQPYVQALDFVLHDSPRGSEMFANYGQTWKALRERASHQDYLFRVFQTWEAETPEYKKLIDLLTVDPKLTKENIDGFQVAEKDGIYCSFQGYTAYCFMHARTLETDSPLVALFGAYHEGGASNLEFIFSDFVDELIKISERTDIPDGEYDSNPKYSVPDVVNKVTKKYGIEEDAAILYLQILSLPFPTDACVRKWNGWKKAQHDKAIAVLLKKELVLEAKRSRAGRKIFIPGFWEVNKARLPIEAWKFSQLDWADEHGEWLYHRPFPSCILSAPSMLFTDAWERVNDGDGPKFGSIL